MLFFIWMTEKKTNERDTEWTEKKKMNKLTDFKQMKHKWKSKTTTNSIDRTEWIKKTRFNGFSAYATIIYTERLYVHAIDVPA